MSTHDELTKLVRETWEGEKGEFRPCAFFDDRLDCIRVIARDCSVYEKRINDRITVLVDNYDDQPGRRKYVGFTVKGARHFCLEYGLAATTSISMTALLDALLASSPEPAVVIFIDAILKPLVEEERIDSVEIPSEPLHDAV